MKNRWLEAARASVSPTKRARETLGRWPWVEPAVWTDRMLAALEKGVKGGKCHKYVFERLDRWVRVRLRAILWKRAGRHGYPKGDANVRWPNSFFADKGLLFLAEARLSAVQSAARGTTNWRAVSGKTRRTVRRGGRPG